MATNGRQNHKFGRKWSSKLQVQHVQKYCAGTYSTDGITCGRKSGGGGGGGGGGDEKQLINLEWPRQFYSATLFITVLSQ